VLKLEDGSTQKFDDLSGLTGEFSAIEDKEGLKIVGVWVKSGSNASGDGPGYGEYVGESDEGSEEQGSDNNE